MVDLTGVLTPKEGRDIETITGEILELKKTAGESILGIGHRLLEAKSVLKHGEWLPWLSERVDLSERAAQNFMRLAREWSNPQTLADLGASKALALLAVPAEDREEFIAAAHVVDGGEPKKVADMSTRELAQAIKDRDKAQAEAASAKSTADEAVSMASEAVKSADAERSLRAKAQARAADAEARAADLQRQLDEALAARQTVEVVEAAPPAATETQTGEEAQLIARARTLLELGAQVRDQLDETIQAAARARYKCVGWMHREREDLYL